MEEKENRVKLARILTSAGLLVAAAISSRLASLGLWQQLLLYLPAYLVAGYDVVLEALECVAHGEPFDEDLLMTIATVGALLIGFLPNGEPEFAEAVFVMLFFQVGELFEDLAEDRARDSISELMDIRPDVANLERDGELVSLDPTEVHVGDVVLVRPGEKVPLDGIVLDGRSSLNTVALTGESLPRDVAPGDDVASGVVNVSGALRVRVSKEFDESTASRILDLVQNASEGKSRSESFISRFARVYTPIVVFAAIALAIVPPLLSGDFAASLSVWLLRALTFLVVSCPCALVISIPLTFFGGIGGAGRRGILIKGSNYMEALAKAQTVAFDKTGTLTQGSFEVEAVHPDAIDANSLLHLAAHVERYSMHPVAVTLRNAYPNEHDDCDVSDVEEVPGQGVRAMVNGRQVVAGSSRLMESVGAQWRPCDHKGAIIHVAVDGVYVGHIVMADQVKAGARESLARMRAEGVQRLVMLTGDGGEVAEQIGGSLGIDDVRANLLPGDKVAAVEGLIASKPEGTTVAFVGDGINDAPVLARADVGIAMGAMGSDAAIEAADVVLMDDGLDKIAEAIRIARKTLAIARQNIAFAIGVKLAILVLAALGLAPMWLAVFGDVGVMVLAVLNASRTLRI